MLFAKHARSGAVAILTLFAMMIASFAQAAEDGLKVEDAWIRMAAPSAKTQAAYFAIANSGNQARELVAVECDSFEKTELHTTQINNGIATMRPVARVEIPANGNVKFAQGGLHVMLINPKEPLAEGAKVELRLVFADGARLPVTAVVQKSGPAGGHMHMH